MQLEKLSSAACRSASETPACAKSAQPTPSTSVVRATRGIAASLRLGHQCARLECIRNSIIIPLRKVVLGFFPSWKTFCGFAPWLLRLEANARKIIALLQKHTRVLLPFHESDGDAWCLVDISSNVAEQDILYCTVHHWYKHKITCLGTFERRLAMAFPQISCRRRPYTFESTCSYILPCYVYVALWSSVEPAAPSVDPVGSIDERIAAAD